MALARVQVFGGNNTTFASSVVTEGTVTVTAGNLIIAVVEADTVAANGVTVVDNKSNTWARLISTSLAATFDLEVWYSVITTGGSGYIITATDNGGGVDSCIVAEEWSGTANPAQDKSAGATGTASAALNSGSSGTLSQANEVVFGVGAASGAVTLTAGGAFTNLNKRNTTFSTLALESQIVASTAAVTATMTASVAGSWVCQVATFKEAGGTMTVVKPVSNLALLGVA